MNEYLALGHMREISQKRDDETPNCYIPYHMVTNEKSTTTNCRVVFNASSKTKNGKSLNNVLMTGPKLQTEIFNHLIKFRSYRVAFAADIEKMYRQILISDEYCKYQRIVWRATPSDSLKSFELQTITYGTSCAPFLALRTLQQLYQDEEQNFPLAAKIARENIYIDDLLSGADTDVEAKSIIIEIQNLLKSGGFILRKWSSSHPKVLQDLDTSLLASKPIHSLEELASAKILTTCTVEADFVLNSIPLVVKSNPLEPIISKFSNFTKLIRVIALCKRFINNCKSGSKVKGQLKSEEVESAHKFLVKTIQQAKYSQEISHLKYHKPIPRSSKLLSLNKFLDEDEILRVGGRLTKQPTLSFDQKFPIIIPKHHLITTLVIRQFHLRSFHSGTQMTLSLIRQRYWIPDGRSTVRREIKRCIECCRFNSKPSYPKMGDLPKQRITETRPFEIVGIDFAGPILTKCQHLRRLANLSPIYIFSYV
ncbi:LINE-1 retrotransposable element ORF2 protein [Trichonephila clavipes]|nr:LINE-1 retrotransposable element ORF2 protein [Trichonephila clavipes]